MEGETTKIYSTNSHPSVSFHKPEILKPASKKQTPSQDLASDEVGEIEETFKESQHGINKTAVIIGVLGVVALLFIALR